MTEAQRAKLMSVRWDYETDPASGILVSWIPGYFPFTKSLTSEDQALTFEEIAEKYNCDLPAEGDYTAWKADQQ